MSGKGIEKDQSARRNVQRQPEERCDQEQCRKDRERKRLGRIHRDEQDQEANRQVDDQQEIEHHRRKRHDHHRDDRDDCYWQEHVTLLEQALPPRSLGGTSITVCQRRCCGGHLCRRPLMLSDAASQWRSISPVAARLAGQPTDQTLLKAPAVLPVDC